MKMSITKLTVAVVASMAAAGVAQATLLTPGTWSGSDAIPEGNPVGIATSVTVSDPGDLAINDVSVQLNISGGYDGNLYGYLVYQPSSEATTAGNTPSMIVLLNQIGTSGINPFGEAGAGFNVTLSDSGTLANDNGGDIHSASGSPVTGIYTPDSSQTFDETFTGSADGTWTLFLADLSAGGGVSTLNSWQVDISVVPEPITWALVGFAGALGLARFIAWRRQSKTA
jgi:hypothetical protein